MAPATEYQGSFLSRISIRRNQVVSMDVVKPEVEDLDDFQKHVAERFSDLSSSSDSDPILSISWLHNLLDVFMSCEAEFKETLTTTPISKSPSLDRVLPEMLDRIVKALDICNAVINGIDSVRKSQRLVEIAVTAFKQGPLCDGNVRRAKRALESLRISSNADGKDRNSGSSCNSRKTTSRSWSFGQRNNVTGGGGGGSYCQVSKNWSAAKQIQAMVTNLTLPHGVEASGPAMTVYIMSNIMVLVMWVLVAAIPCQTSNLPVTALQLPKHQNWTSGAVNIQEKIGEEMKKKEKRCSGLMRRYRGWRRLDYL